MARLLVLMNSVVLLLFGSDMFLVGASKYTVSNKRVEEILATVGYGLLKQTTFSHMDC